jgi:hypothetical protein
MDPEETSGTPRELSRREFLALLGAAGVLATGVWPTPAWAEPGRAFTHEGMSIFVQGSEDGELALKIDGEPVQAVYSNGAYRAANFMYSPQPSLEDLAKRVADYQVALAKRGGQ